MFIQHGMFGIVNSQLKQGPRKEFVNLLERNVSIQERMPKWGGFEIQLKLLSNVFQGGIHVFVQGSKYQAVVSLRMCNESKVHFLIDFLILPHPGSESNYLGFPKVSFSHRLNFKFLGNFILGKLQC